jgi:hypothetical protein
VVLPKRSFFENLERYHKGMALAPMVNLDLGY